MNQYHTEHINQNKMYSIIKTEQDEAQRNIYGLIIAGEKGISSDLVENHNNSINIKHSRTPNEYELLKFFFLIHISRNDKAFIILQSNSRQGVYSSIKDRIYDIINQYDTGTYTVDINKYYTRDELYQVLTQAKINDIRFISHNVSSDFADLQNTNSEKCVATTTFSRITDEVKDKIFGRELAYLRRGIHVEGGIEFDVGHGYDDIKVSITSGNKSRLLSIRQDDFDIDEDITNIVEKNNDGNPVYDSIKTLAIEKLNSLL